MISGEHISFSDRVFAQLLPKTWDAESIFAEALQRHSCIIGARQVSFITYIDQGMNCKPQQDNSIVKQKWAQISKAETGVRNQKPITR